jgi:hypothetical protein
LSALSSALVRVCLRRDWEAHGKNRADMRSKPGSDVH